MKEKSDRNIKRKSLLASTAIVLIYMTAGSLWIILSDAFVMGLADDPETLTLLQNYKGWLYIFLTGLLLWVLIRMSYRRILESGKEIAEKDRILATLFQNLPGTAYRCRNDRDWTMEFLSDGSAGN